jgi:hypothetical protein
VTDYLQHPNLYALPASQRKLMTLILRKLLASSTFAISGTLDGLASRLEDVAHEQESRQDVAEQVPSIVAEDFETYDELADEWDEEDDGADKEDRHLSPEQIAEVREEVDKLKEFAALAKSVVKNSKGSPSHRADAGLL